ncbi:Uncharacterised protein [Serratia fonticola]|uniref:Uncharacterized protein n=1 Tax=Serratia fonticola TaxID=47917 RepID=A0A4U9U639_SERFO|nr:Uncharacterised protein [Serratia fonticola]
MLSRKYRQVAEINYGYYLPRSPLSCAAKILIFVFFRPLLK